MINLSHLGKFFMSIKPGIGLLASTGATALYMTSELSYGIFKHYPPFSTTLSAQHKSVCLKDRSHICMTWITEFKVC